MTGETEWPLPPRDPVRSTLTSVVVLFVRLRRKTSRNRPLPPLVTRLLAELRKRTKRPSALMTDPEESLFPPAASGIEGSASDTACTAESATPSIADARTQPRIAPRNTFVCDCFMDASYLPVTALCQALDYTQRFVLVRIAMKKGKKHATCLGPLTS